MAKQDFEQFKQDIKEWLSNHPKKVLIFKSPPLLFLTNGS